MDSDALGFAGAGCGRKTDAAWAVALEYVRINFGAKVFEDGLNGCGNNLAEAANGSEAHGLGKFVEQCEVGAILRFGKAALRPADQEVDHFLRADATGDALAAGFVAIEAHGIEGHVEHAGGVVADDDGAGAEHGTSFGKRFEIEVDIDHGSRQIAGRWTGGRKGFQLATTADATGMIEEDFTHRSAHGNFVDAR